MCIIIAGVLAAALSVMSAAKAVAIPKPAAPISHIDAPAFGVPFPGNPAVTPTITARAIRDNALYGVSCITWTRCIAVGTQASTSAVAVRPLGEWWTGARWRVMPMPDPVRMPRAVLGRISCQSRDNCVAVGYHYSGGGGFTVLAEHWNGRQWQIIQSANRPDVSSAFLNDVACQLRVGCIAVGGHSGRSGEGRALAEHWVLGHWQVLRARWPAGARTSELDGVSCAGGICLAVGMYQAASGQVRPLAERWTGRYWRVLHPAGARAPIGLLDDVSCAAAQMCMAVGYTQWTQQRPLAELWQPGHWQLVPGGRVAGGLLNGVSCQLRTWCVTVGAVAGKPLTEAWYGKDWAVTPSPRVGGRPADELNQLSCRTYNGRCVTVGVRYEPGQAGGEVTLAEWWTGRAWRVMVTRNP